MRKSPEASHLAVERFFAGMAERGVSKIMGERQGLGEILVEIKRPAYRARDLRHFEAVRQAGAVVVALVIDKDLGLVRQPAKRGRMDNPVAVALKRRAQRVLGLGMEPPAGLFRLRRIGRERSNHGGNLPMPSYFVHPGHKAPRNPAPVRPGPALAGPPRFETAAPPLDALPRQS